MAIVFFMAGDAVCAREFAVTLVIVGGVSEDVKYFSKGELAFCFLR